MNHLLLHQQLVKVNLGFENVSGVTEIICAKSTMSGLSLQWHICIAMNRSGLLGNEIHSCAKGSKNCIYHLNGVKISMK